jgi:hypothetical protein
VIPGIFDFKLPEKYIGHVVIKMLAGMHHKFLHSGIRLQSPAYYGSFYELRTCSYDT